MHVQAFLRKHAAYTYGLLLRPIGDLARPELELVCIHIRHIIYVYVQFFAEFSVIVLVSYISRIVICAA